MSYLLSSLISFSLELMHVVPLKNLFCQFLFSEFVDNTTHVAVLWYICNPEKRGRGKKGGGGGVKGRRGE